MSPELFRDIGLNNPSCFARDNVISGNVRGGNKLLISEKERQLIYLDNEISFL